VKPNAVDGFGVEGSSGADSPSVAETNPSETNPSEMIPEHRALLTHAADA